MSKLHQLVSYLEYWLNAVDKHSLQAPYVYTLYNSVIRRTPGQPRFPLIEHLRSELQQSKKMIPAVDLGAKSQVTKGAERPISEIAKKGITQKKYSELIFRISEYLEAKNIIELGTSVGINTLYLSVVPGAQVSTFEGSPALCTIARCVFKELNKTNIEIIEGNIDEKLEAFLLNSPPVDLAFIDANHRYAPTKNYYALLSKKLHDNSCLIFDDIHWSKEMEQAWSAIKNDDKVTLSIDLYQMGIVFFNPDLRKQHYVLQF